MKRRVKEILSRYLKKGLSREDMAVLSSLTEEEQGRKYLDAWLYARWKEEKGKNLPGPLEADVLSKIRRRAGISESGLNLEKESFDQFYGNGKSKNPVPLRNFLKAAVVIALLAIGGYTLARVFRPVPSVQTETLNVIAVPLGSRTSLTLSDGTKIWLNSGSSLYIPDDFSMENRWVSLQGEAYFEVRSSEKHFFKVKNLGPEIVVLGTRFNVKSYADKGEVTTTLFEGLVRLVEEKPSGKVMEYILKPEHSVTYRKNTGKLHVRRLKASAGHKTSADRINKPESSLDAEQAISSWKDEILVFQHERFEDIVQKLHRWYGVEIVLEDETLNDLRFTGVFRNKESVFEVLDAIMQTTPIEFKEKGRVLHIYATNNNPN